MVTKNTFLTAEWRKLAMANYAIDAKILKPYLPYGTEIDLWQDTCYISLVGFMFLNTGLKGFKIPFHTNFEEVNLRFYVRYNDNGTCKRGVVFLKEIVPKPALTWVANTVYGEHYETMLMAHEWRTEGDLLHVTYKWKKGNWNTFGVTTSKIASEIAIGSEEEFITEHYWGYTRLNHSKTSQYEVEHPRWKVYNTKSYHIDVDFAKVYGEDFGFLKNEIPRSVFLAEGSAIQVNKGEIIKELPQEG